MLLVLVGSCLSRTPPDRVIGFGWSETGEGSKCGTDRVVMHMCEASVRQVCFGLGRVLSKLE